MGAGRSGLCGWPSPFSRGVGIQAPTALVALSHGGGCQEPVWPRSHLQEGRVNPDLRGEYHQLPAGVCAVGRSRIGPRPGGSRGGGLPVGERGAASPGVEPRGFPWPLEWCHSLVNARDLGGGEVGPGTFWHGLSWPHTCVCGCTRHLLSRARSRLSGIPSFCCSPSCHNTACHLILTLSFSFLCVVSGEKRFV